jgi:RNA polymerase sigma factor (sigma-70 family)
MARCVLVSACICRQQTSNPLAGVEQMHCPLSLGGDAPSDLELLARWRRGDNRAGGTLAQRHLGSLYRFFTRRAHGYEDDLVQQTLIACIEARDTFRGESSFRAYLFGIARLQLLSHYRSAHRPSVLNQGVTSGASCSAPSARSVPDEGLLLKLALRQIPAVQRTALELTYWEDLTAPEVAKRLGIRENTLYSRLRRGKAQLRYVLERH